MATKNAAVSPPVPAPTLRRSCPLPTQSPPRYKKRTIAVLVEEGEGLLELGNLLLSQLISHGCGLVGFLLEKTVK